MTDAATTTPWQRIRRAAQVVWVLLIVVFLAYYLRENWAQLRGHEWRLAWHFCAAALAWGMLRKLIGGLRWALIATYDSPQLQWRDLLAHLRVYFMSSLAMYVPGSLWYVAVRIEMNRTRGVGTLRTSLGLVYESGLLVWSGALVGTYAGAIAFPQVRWLIGIATVLLAAGAIALVHPPSVNAVLRRLLKLLGRPVAAMDVEGGRNTQILVLSLALWLAGGFSLFYLIRAVDPSLSYDRLLPVTSAAALAWTVGFLAPWAPSGLGVREGLLVWLLQTWVAEPVAVVATVAYRLVTLAEDLLWAVIVISAERLQSTGR